MKKIITLSIALLAFTFSNAQETTKNTKPAKKITVKTAKATTAALPKVDGAGMVFVSETIDYGTIAHNADGKRKFVFTNNGNKPLIITNLKDHVDVLFQQLQKNQLLQVQKDLLV